MGRASDGTPRLRLYSWPQEEAHGAAFEKRPQHRVPRAQPVAEKTPKHLFLMGTGSCPGASEAGTPGLGGARLGGSGADPGSPKVPSARKAEGRAGGLPGGGGVVRYQPLCPGNPAGPRSCKAARAPGAVGGIGPRLAALEAEAAAPWPSRALPGPASRVPRGTPPPVRRGTPRII